MIRLRILGFLAAAALAAAACSDDTITVDVFAASSLTDAFTELEERYEAANPGVDIRLNLAGSDTLRRQIDDGANADVFAPADVELFDGLDTQPAIYASNQLLIVVPAGRNLVTQRIQDNDLDDLVVAQCAAGVPCGDAAEILVEEFALDLTSAVVTSEPNVRAVLSKVLLGEADLGFVYRSDARSAEGEVIWLAPDIPEASVTLGVAVLDDAADHARGFVDFVVDPSNRDVFDSLGFDPAP